MICSRSGRAGGVGAPGGPTPGARLASPEERAVETEDRVMTDRGKKKGCRKPENLKGKPGGCSPEQVRKCHGGEKKHPCAGKREG